MARRGGRGTDRGTGGQGAGGRRADDAADSGVWSLGEYEWEGDDRSSPPWEQDGWEDQLAPPSRRPPGGMRGGLSVGLTGNSDLGAGHPSGPLPPVRGRRARPGSDDYPTGGFPGQDYPTGGFAAGDYPAGDHSTGGFPTGNFPAGDYATGGFQAGDYPTGGFPAAGGRAAGSGRHGAPDRGAGSGARAADPYRSGPFPAGAYNTGAFGAQPYGEDEDYEGDGYEDPAGYADDEYEAEAEDDWYEDEDDDQDWDEDDDQDAFLPGMSTVYATRAGEPGRRAGRGKSGSAKGKAKSKAGRGRGKRRVGKWIALTVLILFLGAGGGGFYYPWTAYLHPADYSGAGSGSVEVHIANGDTATTVGNILLADGVVASARAFHNAAVANPKGSALEPGYYLLHKHMQASLALAMLLNPSSRVVIKITIPEGLRLTDIIARLGAATHNLAGYQAAIKDVSALGLPSYAGGKPEGYLFPSTYQILPDTPPIKVLQEMVAAYKTQVAALALPKWAAHDQMTPAEIITAASIVQAEGGRTSDFPKIAEVLYNRMNDQMMLQCDSTVMYALGTIGIAATQQQLNAAQKSPYDTYSHYGLPPGPIDSPGAAAIQATLHPSKVGGYLYFVTVDPKAHITKFTADPNQAAIWAQELQAAIAKGNG